MLHYQYADDTQSCLSFPSKLREMSEVVFQVSVIQRLYKHGLKWNLIEIAIMVTGSNHKTIIIRQVIIGGTVSPILDLVGGGFLDSGLYLAGEVLVSVKSTLLPA